MSANIVNNEYDPPAAHSTSLDAAADRPSSQASSSNMKGKGKLPLEGRVKDLPPEIIEQYASLLQFIQPITRSTQHSELTITQDTLPDRPFDIHVAHSCQLCMAQCCPDTSSLRISPFALPFICNQQQRHHGPIYRRESQDVEEAASARGEEEPVRGLPPAPADDHQLHIHNYEFVCFFPWWRGIRLYILPQWPLDFGPLIVTHLCHRHSLAKDISAAGVEGQTTAGLSNNSR